MDNQEQMMIAIIEGVNELFDNESHLKRFEWEKIDLTAFFTAYIKAGAYMFNKITNEDKNYLEFTHLANQLIFQDMLKGKKAEEQDDEESDEE